MADAAWAVIRADAAGAADAVNLGSWNPEVSKLVATSRRLLVFRLIASEFQLPLSNPVFPKIFSAPKKKTRKLDRATARREFLALKPQRNPSLTWEEVEERVVLRVPRPNTIQVRIVNIFFPVPEERKVVLDPIGSDVWRACDGQATIADISKILGRNYKLGTREAELSLQQFFKDLGQRGYIGFAVPTTKAKSK